MTDLDRNTRTLIVCFSLALMALIPLRFVEVGQGGIGEKPMVLGETIEKKEIEVRSGAILEAPYDEIDGVNLRKDDCLSMDEARMMIDKITEGLIRGDYNEAEIEEIILEAEEVESRLCK